ncbi:MAG: MvdD family ATP-grasp ribosomal peptide maturase, partial [Pseudomonadota bacterium]|nr:MvdD family ATP-grasp ribosomal peptide maturase [Pseudomonadota bacterium]
RAVRVDTDRFPTELQLSIAPGDPLAPGLLRAPEMEVNLADVSAVWYRRAAIAKRLPADLDAQTRAACLGESRRVLFGFIDGLGVYTLGGKAAVERAEIKVLQLQIARAVGLDVPRTLVSNDPAQVRAFAARCDGALVAKMMHSFAIYDDAGNEGVVFTNPVSAADLADLDGLALCPMTFQERLPKARELRVTVVGDRVFAASIDSQASPRAQHDWRRDGERLMEDWQPTALPTAAEEGLLRLVERLGLDYGAADFILTPDGRCVFLEINPAGEFFWLQDHPGLPIAEAIADVLLGLAPRRAVPLYLRG